MQEDESPGGSLGAGDDDDDAYVPLPGSSCEEPHVDSNAPPVESKPDSTPSPAGGKSPVELEGELRDLGFVGTMTPDQQLELLELLKTIDKFECKSTCFPQFGVLFKFAHAFAWAFPSIQLYYTHS